jgi:hypothetical protein
MGGGDVAAKLLGHYEAELHPVIERLVMAGFDQISISAARRGFMPSAWQSAARCRYQCAACLPSQLCRQWRPTAVSAARLIRIC